MLTAAQRDQYRTFGFLILRGYFSADEVAALRAQLEDQLAREHPDQGAHAERRDWTCMLGSPNTAFHGLLEDPRFLDLADELHGRSVPIWCDGNRYGATDTGWHADVIASLPDALDHAGIKFIHYLQPLTAANGALRVIPGSHRRPLHESIAAYVTDHAPGVAQLPAVACETEPGDVVAFHHAIFHAAASVRTKRLMHTLAYYPLDGSRDFLDRFCALYRSEIMPGNRKAFGFEGEVYPASWIAGARSLPRRREAIVRMREAGTLAALGADMAAVAEVLDGPAPERGDPIRRSA